MRRRRTLFATLRFARFLLHEFRWPLGIFFLLVFGGGALLSATYTKERFGWIEGSYDVFLMVFMQPQLKFPDQVYLRAFFFLAPVVGLGAVADSFARLAYFIFARKQQLQEWQIMNASAMKDHVVVVGLGKVGYRILKELHALREEAVAIETRMESELVAELLDLGVPVIRGDGRRRKVLEEANVARAKAVILATDDDVANIDAALTAREIKPEIRVVVRLFDDTLAAKVAPVFKMPVLSTSHTAAPAFVAAATGRNVYHAFVLDGQPLQMADLVVEEGSALVGKSVGDLHRRPEVNIVMHQRGGTRDVGPDGGIALLPGDKLVVMAPPEKVYALIAEARPR